jgi:hypothetical protein
MCRRENDAFRSAEVHEAKLVSLDDSKRKALDRAEEERARTPLRSSARHPDCEARHARHIGRPLSRDLVTGA